jgi:hypothetical protein
MTNEFKDWLALVWNRRPGVLLRTWVVLVLDAFKGCLTPAMKTTFTGNSLNTELVIISKE